MFKSRSRPQNIIKLTTNKPWCIYCTNMLTVNHPLAFSGARVWESFWGREDNILTDVTLGKSIWSAVLVKVKVRALRIPVFSTPAPMRRAFFINAAHCNLNFSTWAISIARVLNACSIWPQFDLEALGEIVEYRSRNVYILSVVRLPVSTDSRSLRCWCQTSAASKSAPIKQPPLLLRLLLLEGYIRPNALQALRVALVCSK